MWRLIDSQGSTPHPADDLVMDTRQAEYKLAAIFATTPRPHPTHTHTHFTAPLTLHSVCRETIVTQDNEGPEVPEAFGVRCAGWLLLLRPDLEPPGSPLLPSFHSLYRAVSCTEWTQRPATVSFFFFFFFRAQKLSLVLIRS